MNLWSSSTWTKLPPSNFLRSSPLTLCTASWILYLFIYLRLYYFCHRARSHWLQLLALWNWRGSEVWIFQAREAVASYPIGAKRRGCRLFDVQVSPVSPLWHALQPLLPNIIVTIDAHSLMTSQLWGLKLQPLGWNYSRQSRGRKEEREAGETKTHLGVFVSSLRFWWKLFHNTAHASFLLFCLCAF